ncbi:MAG: hypothetical protein GX491_06530 [Chloroflexi bacterium]|nr:hypothetical protein [Chloroflexota bacterium]
MPIQRFTPEVSKDQDSDVALNVFHIQEAIEVYDGALALAIDHLLNHIKVLVSLAYLPGSSDLEQALSRHPVLRRWKKKNGSFFPDATDGRSPDRVLLAECQRLLDGVLEMAHLAAWPETNEEARLVLEQLQQEVPFLDYRYDNDPFPSDKDREEPK